MAGPSQRCMSKSTPLEFLASKQESKKHRAMHFVHPSTKTLGIPQATTEPQTQSGEQQRVYPEAWEWICLSSSAATGPRPPLTKKHKSSWRARDTTRSKWHLLAQPVSGPYFILFLPTFGYLLVSSTSWTFLCPSKTCICMQSKHIKTYQNNVYCRSL